MEIRDNENAQDYVVTYFDNGDPAVSEALKSKWQTYNRYDPATKKTYKILIRPTAEVLEMMVDRLVSTEMPAGRYRIETFIPGKHATTRKALFIVAHDIHTNEKGEQQLDEKLVMVDMYDLYDVWKSLGEYELDPQKHPEIGRVRQFDITREEPAEEISFGPVRWLPVPPPSLTGVRFDSPVGTEEERNGPFPSGRIIFRKYPLWAGDWFDVNPFLNWYALGYHTGSDLNLPGSSGADKGKPIYSIGDGLVTYAGKAGSWGYIVVIEHPEALVSLPDGNFSRQMVYSRYGHVEAEIPVRTGETVTRGQLIGHIGLSPGSSAGWHLHFDISYSDILKKRPSFWPDQTSVRQMSSSQRATRAYNGVQNSVMREVMSHFVDPFKFLEENHIQGG